MLILFAIRLQHLTVTVTNKTTVSHSHKTVTVDSTACYVRVIRDDVFLTAGLVVFVGLSRGADWLVGHVHREHCRFAAISANLSTGKRLLLIVILVIISTLYK